MPPLRFEFLFADAHADPRSAQWTNCAYVMMPQPLPVHTWSTGRGWLYLSSVWRGLGAGIAMYILTTYICQLSQPPAKTRWLALSGTGTGQLPGQVGEAVTHPPLPTLIQHRPGPARPAFFVPRFSRQCSVIFNTDSSLISESGHRIHIVGYFRF